MFLFYSAKKLGPTDNPMSVHWKIVSEIFLTTKNANDYTSLILHRQLLHIFLQG